MKKILITLAAVVMSATFALVGAPAASAWGGGGGVCVTGPWGYVTGCVQGPGWVDWNPWNNWNPGWNNGWHGHGHGHGGWDD